MAYARKKKGAKTAFVPRSLFVSVLVTTSVVPLCACGGTVETGSASGDAGGAESTGATTSSAPWRAPQRPTALAHSAEATQLEP